MRILVHILKQGAQLVQCERLHSRVSGLGGQDHGVYDSGFRDTLMACREGVKPPKMGMEQRHQKR